MELTTGETAARLGVNTSRVRALIATGGLAARRVGQQWLVDADSVTAQHSLIVGHATGRSMSQRIAWATAALADGRNPDWITASERSRIHRRLRTIAGPDVVRRWLSSRADEVRTYRVGADDLVDVLATADVLATGVSATTAYGLGLTVTGQGDAYVTRELHDRLMRDHFLIETDHGNLTLRVVDHDWHLRTARGEAEAAVAARLIVGVDLADDPDARTRQLGLGLIVDALSDFA